MISDRFSLVVVVLVVLVVLGVVFSILITVVACHYCYLIAARIPPDPLNLCRLRRSKARRI